MLLVVLLFLFGGAFSIGGFSSGGTQDAVGYFHTYETGSLAVHARVGEIALVCACASEAVLQVSLLGRLCWSVCGDRFTEIETESGCVCV